MSVPYFGGDDHRIMLDFIDKTYTIWDTVSPLIVAFPCATFSGRLSYTLQLGRIPLSIRLYDGLQAASNRDAYNLPCITMGILQSISVISIGKLYSGQLRHQRIFSRGRKLEAFLLTRMLEKY